uniref:Uncharacterized protein n=1 Tax=Arundo donax TaxID=35708 RepID=A0A0A9A4Q3_ARUDO
MVFICLCFSWSIVNESLKVGFESVHIFLKTLYRKVTSFRSLWDPPKILASQTI